MNVSDERGVRSEEREGGEGAAERWLTRLQERVSAELWTPIGLDEEDVECVVDATIEQLAALIRNHHRVHLPYLGAFERRVIHRAGQAGPVVDRAIIFYPDPILLEDSL